MNTDPQALAANPAVPLPAGVLPLLPMRNLVLFPHASVAVTVGRERSVAALQQAFASDGLVGVVLQTDAHADEPGLEALCRVGCTARLMQYARTSDGLHHVVCEGLRRFDLLQLQEGWPFLAAHVELVPESQALTVRAEALLAQLRERLLELMALWPAMPAELAARLQASRDAGEFADLLAGLLNGEAQDRQALLELKLPEQRLDELLQRLVRRIGVLRLSQEMGLRAREQLEGRQREVLLREQLKAIQHELGEGEHEVPQDLGALERALAAAGLPAEAAAQIDKDLQRLKRTRDHGGETASLQRYLEWVSELPWTAQALPPVDLSEARRLLDVEHHGQDQVKQRVLEFLAVRKLKPEGPAPILCLMGPPGVGKTSLAQSMAKALGRPFVRVALGGVHDEAEIRGHRRTYLGAMPGVILQGLRRAGSRQCLVLLDEIDKMGRGPQGDPAAALLELLDPQQNVSFRDNYLGLPFDLSGVFFVATANQLDTVSPALRDRLELIELSSYTQAEKLAIAQRFLLPRQRDLHGLGDVPVSLDDALMRLLIESYTREAGVRQLERELARLMRHLAMQVAQGKTPQPVTDAALRDWLGPPAFEHETALRLALPGVSTALAWTPTGGELLFIEATKVAGRGRLILTGQLGEVMKESAQTALTLLKAMAASLGVDARQFEGQDVHLHVPAGAIPKDGPSAGVAMLVALASLFTGRPVRHDVAMTGELSLRGLVLPVGGVREKLLAADRAGLRCVMLPARNEKDLQDIPPDSLERLALVWLRHVDDALRSALQSPAEADVSPILPQAAQANEVGP